MSNGDRETLTTDYVAARPYTNNQPQMIAVGSEGATSVAIFEIIYVGGLPACAPGVSMVTGLQHQPPWRLQYHPGIGLVMLLHAGSQRASGQLQGARGMA